MTKMAKEKNILKLVKKTIDKYNLSRITPGEIRNVITANGYLILRFSPDEDSETMRLIEHLDLEEYADVLDSFSYRSRDRRLVFIRKNVSDEEFLYLSCLELGRILTYTDTFDGVLGTSPDDNASAFEFAYHMTDMARHGFFYNFFMKYTVNGIVSTAILALCLIASFVFIGVTQTAKYIPEATDEIGTAVSSGIVSEERTATVSTTISEEKSVDTVISSPESPKSEVTEAVASREETPTPTAEEKPVEQPSAKRNDDGKYFATKSGTKYHIADCSYLSGRETKSVSLSDIASGKYSPCSRCITE